MTYQREITMPIYSEWAQNLLTGVIGDDHFYRQKIEASIARALEQAFQQGEALGRRDVDARLGGQQL